MDDPPRSYTVAARLQSSSPYGDSVDNTTQGCVGASKNQLTGREPDPVGTHALLFHCHDVNPRNTFLDRGYNPGFPPAGEPPTDDFTGREFVLYNQNRDTLDAVAVPLPVIE